MLKTRFEILRQVCEYLLASSPPLLDPPVNLSLSRGPLPPTSLNLSWSRREEGGWGPTHWIVTACPTLSLAGVALIKLSQTNLTGGNLNAGCKESTVTGDSPNHLQLNQLEPYTEYKVVLAAHLGSLNISQEEEVVGRTGPLQPVSWSVGLDGLLTVVWRERVAEFRGKDPVQVK